MRHIKVRCARCGAPAIGQGKVDGQGYCVEHALGVILVALKGSAVPEEEPNGA